MKYGLGIIITLAVLGVGALLFAWSGIYNIAATKPHSGITLSFIEMLRDRSISARSYNINVPDLDEPKFIEPSFNHYHEMCRLCHGAPDYQPEEFANDLYPQPPSMTSGHIQKKRSHAEIYWIVKHGIKMTGMPAFGPTHSDSELKEIVTLAMDIPQISPDEYRRFIRKMELEKGARHGHGSVTPAPDESEHGHN